MHSVSVRNVLLEPGLLNSGMPVERGARVTSTLPDPTPVLVAMERLGARPETTVFVGDSPHDMASGRAAGVRTAAALWGPFPRETLEPHQPDFWLGAPTELHSL